MLRTFTLVATIVASGILLLFGHKNSIIVAIATGLIAGALIPLIDNTIQARRYLKLAVQSLRYWNESVRISASYLFRIEVDGRFLLVRGNRFPQFQPVGGVYKSTERGNPALRRIGAVDDSLIPFDSQLEKDLRIRIKGKQLLPFLFWFESERGRERDPWREFHEELVAPGYLSLAAFPYISYEILQRRVNPLRYSHQAQCRELLIADIVELIPTADQLEELRRLKAEGEPSIRWVTADSITRLATEPGLPTSEDIAVTASWTLEPKGS